MYVNPLWYGFVLGVLCCLGVLVIVAMIVGRKKK